MATLANSPQIIRGFNDAHLLNVSSADQRLFLLRIDDSFEKCSATQANSGAIIIIFWGRFATHFAGERSFWKVKIYKKKLNSIYLTIFTYYFEIWTIHFTLVFPRPNQRGIHFVFTLSFLLKKYSFKKSQSCLVRQQFAAEIDCIVGVVYNELPYPVFTLENLCSRLPIVDWEKLSSNFFLNSFLTKKTLKNEPTMRMMTFFIKKSE